MMQDYTTSIIVVSILAVLLENILPDGNNKKYIRVIIGLLVMLIIVQPLTALPHYSAAFTIPAQRLTDNDLSPPSAQPYIAESFSKKLALQIEDDLHRVFHTAVRCRVRCSVNDEGQITAVDAVTLQPFTQEMQVYVAETYGFEEAVIQP